MSGRTTVVCVIAVLLTVLVGAAPTWAQDAAEPPPDTTPSLGQILGEMEPGERVRLHLPDREPLAGRVTVVSGDSLSFGEEGDTRSVALSRISRLDVGGRAYWKGAVVGGAVGAVAGSVIGALSADWSPDVHHDGTTRPDAEAVVLAPLVSVTVGAYGGALGGGVVGLLVGATITDWEQRYPTR